MGRDRTAAVFEDDLWGRGKGLNWARNFEGAVDSGKHAPSRSGKPGESST
jgi:hypothetical protein